MVSCSFTDWLFLSVGSSKSLYLIYYGTISPEKEFLTSVGSSLSPDPICRQRSCECAVMLRMLRHRIDRPSSCSFLPVTAENKANITTDPKEANNSEKVKNGDEKLNVDTGSKRTKEPVDQEDQAFLEELARIKRQEKEADDATETLRKTFAKINTASTPVNTASTLVNIASLSRNVSAAEPCYPDLSTYANQDDSQIPSLEDIYEVPNDGIFTSATYDDDGVVADFTNLESTMNIEPKKISQALEDKSWVDAMQEELLEFKTQQVWILVDLPFRKKVIRTKWVYRNKKDERGVVVRNKARLVTQGRRQEEGIYYDEVFAPVARIEAIRIFLAFASYMGFIVYQMNAKSAFFYGKINKEVYRRGLIDKTMFIKMDKKDIMLVYVYVDDLIFGSTKKSWCDEFEALIKSRLQMSSMGELTFFLGLHVKQRKDGIFISQDKYIVEILKKFDFMSVKTASTPIETKKPLVKDAEAADVDVHLYRSMIGSLMYLTASRPDIIYVVCACSRESAFDLEAYSDSDHAGANLNRKSTTGCCEFLGKRLILWQCKKQTIIATSTTEAEYVTAVGPFPLKMRSLGKEHVSKHGRKKAKTGTNIKEGTNYVVNKGSYTDKVKVINAKVEGISVAGETLSTATLTEAKMGMRNFFKCWFHYHTTNGHQFTMYSRHQELASPKANGFCKELTSPKQMALGKDFSNPLMADSLLKTIWLSMHHVIAMKHLLLQSKRLLVKKHKIRLWLNVKDAKVLNEFKFIKKQIKEQ
uniref:Reverse transcriptase Ty1/copia-type domain-containing protein n=1 Tax=Tanacetum cinerariifolium TaxID=118510 RepID=A0A699GIW3_TANCI|nr:hypothetical protein [Tanacetum cinerariifolium]